jgi:hypothetical protein
MDKSGHVLDHKIVHHIINLSAPIAVAERTTIHHDIRYRLVSVSRSSSLFPLCDSFLLVL